MEIQYKGFIAKLYFSPNAGAFYGEITNSEDLITFQAATTAEAIETMRLSVESYLSYQEGLALVALVD